MINILRTRTILAAGLMTVLLLLASCGRPAPVPLIFGSAVWADGEESIFTVTDRDGQPFKLTEARWQSYRRPAPTCLIRAPTSWRRRCASCAIARAGHSA